MKKITNTVRVRGYVSPEVFVKLIEQDKDNPNGAKIGFVVGIILEEVVRQNLQGSLMASGRNQKYARERIKNEYD